jgi:transcriptional regulator with XRE-family HTH domain
MSQVGSLKAIACKNIKIKRLELGISQAQLAISTKLTVHYLSKLERNPQNLTLDTLENIAKALGVSVIELLDRGHPPHVKLNKNATDAIDLVIRLLQAHKVSGSR